MIKQYTDKDNTPLNFHNALKILLIINVVYSLIMTGMAFVDLSNVANMPYFVFFLSNFIFSLIITIILALLYIGVRKFNKVIIYFVLALFVANVLSILVSMMWLYLYNALSLEITIQYLFFLIRNIVVQGLILLYYYKRIPILDPDTSNFFKKKEKVIS